MEDLRIRLEELILINGTTDKEVLKVSQLLDNRIVEYYRNKTNLGCKQVL